MITKQHALCQKFHCLAGKCPRNCCKGWQIPVDDATVERYKALSGKEGARIRHRLTKRRGLVVMRKRFGRCPFLTKEHLCSFQVEGRTDLMAVVCRYYPREVITYSDYTEITLSLSCIEAARLFVEEGGRPVLVPAEPAESFWILENEDLPFLDFLLKDRTRMQDAVWDENRSLPDIWAALYRHVSVEHGLIVRDRREEVYADLAKSVGELLAGDEAMTAEAGKCERDAGTVKAVTSGENAMDTGVTGRAPAEDIPGGAGESETYAFFPVSVLDRMILNHIDYGALFVREPAFSALIRAYNRLFRKMGLSEADAFLTDTLREMEAVRPGLLSLLRSYFSCNLDQLYLKAYESYHILRQFLFAVLYTELFALFLVVDYKAGRGKEALTDASLALTLSLVESCVRHNPDMTENLFNVIRSDFL